MFIQREIVALAVSSGGAQTTYTGRVSGRVLQITYVPDASTPLDTGADFTITGEDTGTPILTITNVGTTAVTMAPRQATVTVANAAALYASGGVAVLDHIYLAGERIKIVVAQGGTSKTGTLYVLIG
jgi:hypothetical protein